MNISDEKLDAQPRFGGIFQVLPYPALIVHRNGWIWGTNEAFDRQCNPGVAKAGPRDQSITELFDGAQQDLLDRIFACATGGALTLKLKSCREGDARIRFHVRALRDGPRPAFFILCLEQSKTFGSAFKALNTQLRVANELAAQVRRQHHLLQQSHDELEHFSHAAAHDLQAPLRSIEHCLTFLQEDHGTDLPEEGRAFIRDARNNARRLQNLISDLLTHAQSTRTPNKRTRLDVRQIVEDVAKSLSAAIAESNARIVAQGPLGEVDADRTLLHQMFENLIGNALKYRDPDRRPVVVVSRDTGTGRLTIRDNGQGFDETLKDRLFLPFERLHTQSQIEGSGIGLATCRKICDHHGWQIDAEGTEGQGAAFYIDGMKTLE